MFSFQIDITPRPAPRPRASKYGNVYNESWYKEYVKQISDQAANFTDGIKLSCPLKLDITFYKDCDITAKRYGDIDNLIKGVMDALNNIVYLDDSQVYEICGHKVRSATQGIWIVVFYDKD